MAARRWETLVLSMPPDPGLARLTRLVALHFFRQNGLRIGVSRSGASKVERGWRAVARRTRGSRRASSGGRGSLIFISGAKALEVFWRRPGGWERLLARLERPTET